MSPRSTPTAADPRRVAFDVLRAVSARDAYANLVLPAAIRAAQLSTRDAAFATELTYGTLRGQGTYDAVLTACVSRPLDALDPPLLDALRLGCHQLLGMRVPSHAAVSRSVALVRDAVGHKTTGLANAVLRAVSRDDLAGWVSALAPALADDPVGHRSVATSHPRWVVEALADGLTAASDTGLDDLLAAHNAAPAVTLVARPGLADAGQVAAETGGRLGQWSPYAVVLPGGDPGALAGVRDGRLAVQDEGSQLAALALVGAAVAGPDTRWLDLCAGPGGKAALLGALAADRGATVVANEVSAHRVRLVQAAVRGLPDIVAVRTGDGRRIGDDEPAAYDRVLVDAPCTGLGALRRRPEARWRRQADDVEPLTRLQSELLASAVDATRPGGVVAYCTCSPHPSETRGVLDALLASRSDVELIDAREALGAVGALPSPLPELPTVQLWTHRHGTDSMFISLLRRRGDGDTPASGR